MTRNPVGWFEIYVQDMDRAKAFYENVLSRTLEALAPPGADGSDAAFNSRNILLSDNATVESQPVLEIHADEVKAAHGSTVGQLDANAVFYLQSRGIPEAKARAILTRAFGNEVIDLLEDPLLVSVANAALGAAMRSKTL